MSLAAKDYGDLQNSTTYNKMDCIMKNIIKSNVSWVGYIDWELQQFHGDEYSIINGSSQNAYLIEEEPQLRTKVGLVRLDVSESLSLKLVVTPALILYP